MVEYDIDNCKLETSKHFRNKYMRKWNWDMFNLREAIKGAYKIDKTGKTKYEVYTKGGGQRKIIFVYDKFDDTIFIISGAEKK